MLMKNSGRGEVLPHFGAFTSGKFEIADDESSRGGFETARS